ncbi:MAG: type II toxin-antitoxin system VapC family toxin [Actinomycetota bacterium]
MIVDASALVAIALQDAPAAALAEKLRVAEVKGIGTPTLVETGIVLTAKIGDEAKALLAELLERFDIRAVTFTERHWREAFGAFLRYGKGRHPARLNYGDCLTYAVARLADLPLLCTGDDFGRTDLEIA